MFKTPEIHRVLRGRMGSTKEADGNNGVFQFREGIEKFNILCSDGEGWEHVSVSKTKNGKIVIPTWIEMCKVKNMFWDLEDTVIQYHPSKKDYVNRHPGCLHLWRPVGKSFPVPPKKLVG